MQFYTMMSVMFSDIQHLFI